jgi:hypothetical protein
MQNCRKTTAVIQLANFSARLAGKAAGQGGQGCQAKPTVHGCRARLHAMVQNAESMVKLDNNAVF